MTTRTSRPTLSTSLQALAMGALALTLAGSGVARAGCADLHGERVVAHANRVEIDGNTWYLGSHSGEDAFMTELLDCDERVAAQHLSAWRSRRHHAQMLSVVGLITPFWVVSFPAFEVAALVTGSKGHQERQMLVASLREGAGAPNPTDDEELDASAYDSDE